MSAIKTYTTDKIDAKLNGKANSNHKQAYTAAECTSYTDDSNCGVTAAAVKKAFSVFEPKAHGHSIGNVTGLQDALNSKLDVNGQAKESVTIISPNGRISSPDYGATNKSRVYAQIDISSSQMTTNKPAGDGYIWTHFWDNGSWAGQLFIPTGEYDASNCHLQWRGQNNGVWRSWEDIAWKKEVDAKANANHKHAMSDVTGLEDRINYLENEITSNNGSGAEVRKRAADVTKIRAREDYSYVEFESLSENANIETVYFKRINGQSVVGNGDITISLNGQMADHSSTGVANSNRTPGIFRVLGYTPVSSSNWYGDEVVLTGRALQYVLGSDACFSLKTINGNAIRGSGNISVTAPIDIQRGYLGALATENKAKLTSLPGNSKGTWYYIRGLETGDYGFLSIQRLEKFYDDMDCIAYSSGDQGWHGNAQLFVACFVPANETYYLRGQKIQNVRTNYFKLS